MFIFALSNEFKNMNMYINDYLLFTVGKTEMWL